MYGKQKVCDLGNRLPAKLPPVYHVDVSYSEQSSVVLPDSCACCLLMFGLFLLVLPCKWLRKPFYNYTLHDLKLKGYHPFPNRHE